MAIECESATVASAPPRQISAPLLSAMLGKALSTLDGEPRPESESSGSEGTAAPRVGTRIVGPFHTLTYLWDKETRSYIHIRSVHYASTYAHTGLSRCRVVI